MSTTVPRSHLAPDAAIDPRPEVRYGIIGTGMMGIEHIRNLAALPGARVTALADPYAPSRAAGLAAAGAGTVAFDNHWELIESELCDAVVVASPNQTHVDVLCDLLDTNVAILVEKPICTSLDDATWLEKRVADRSAPLWVGMEYRYMPAIASLIDLVDQGAIGDVKTVAIREHRFPFLPKVDDWNHSTANTGGTLVEKCCHFFDLMALLTGSPARSVMATGGQAVNRLHAGPSGPASDMLDHAFVLVEHENDARSMLDLCMFAEASQHQEEIAVVGSLGKAEAFMPQNMVRFGLRAHHGLADVEETTLRNDHIPYLGHHYGSSYIEHQHFLDAIRYGRPADVDVAAGTAAVAVGVAAQRSIAEGRAVTIKEVR